MKPKKKLTAPIKKPNGLQAYLHLDPAVLHLLEKLEGALNEKLKATGRRPLLRSEVLALVVTQALLDNAGDIQDEATRTGLHRLAVRLAPLFGSDGLATVGLPELPDGAGARSFSRVRSLL